MFKLILGAANRDVKSAREIALFYANSKIDIIDCSPETIFEVQNYLKASGIDINKIQFCASIALFGDIHARKARINNNCINCKSCILICSQKAIEKKDDKIIINSDKCTGCAHCKKICKNKAIDIYNYDLCDCNLKILQNSKLKLDLLEIHLSLKNKKEIIEGFKRICKKFQGNISICISRKYFNTADIIKLIDKLKKIFDKYNQSFSFFVQADGSSINNAQEGYLSNLEAIAFFNELSKLDYKIILSGGLNDKTIELLKLFKLKPYALGFGSYARKLALVDKKKAEKLVYSIKEFYNEL